MLLVSTLCDSRAEALQILREAPNNSVILFPESVPLLSHSIQRYSIEKNLFIIFNNDVVVNGKTYIAMRAIDCGKYQWTVRKFKPWHTDINGGISASEPEPIITIRNVKTGLFICYDATAIFKMYKMLNQEQIEFMFITANWSFNFPLMQRIIDFSLEHIHSLKAVIFSNSNTLSLIKTRTQEKRITKTGYAELTI